MQKDSIHSIFLEHFLQLFEDFKSATAAADHVQGEVEGGKREEKKRVWPWWSKTKHRTVFKYYFQIFKNRIKTVLL